MKAEIIAVGTELLLGDILNTNAQYLAKELAEMGFTVYYQSVVGDNSDRLFSLVSEAKKRSELIILCGGLGPTDDDLTKQTVAKVFGDELILDETELEKIKKYFETTCRPYTDNNQKQAYIPQKGGKFVNDNGTAPSVYFVDGDTTAILLPGPPKELVPLFETKIKPFLTKYQKGVLHSINLNVFGIGESALECKVKDFLNRQNPTSALYAKNGEVRLRVTALGENETAAEKMCIPTVNEIKAIIGDNIYGTNDDTLESVVVALLLKRHKTLATAESCTGGMLSQRITAVSGSSEVFGCGVCTYQNKFKEKLLNVSGKTLEEFDAVSKETATEMANGVKKLADSDLGVSITGFAGPTGGNEKDPVGTVYICVSHDGKNDTRRIQAAGRGRNHVRHMACQHALDMIRRILSDIPLD